MHREGGRTFGSAKRVQRNRRCLSRLRLRLMRLQPHCSRTVKLDSLAEHGEPSFTLSSTDLPLSAYANRTNGATNRVLSSDNCSKAKEEITNAECEARFEGEEPE